MNLQNKAVLLFVVLLLAVQLFAEPPAPADSVKYIFNPVVVTATKFQGPQNELAASVSVITPAEIENSVSSSALELVSELVPSTFITEKNVMGYGVASGAAGGISIRGVGGSPVTGVLVLRDGRPDIMGMMGHAIPDAYSLDGVERIEVIRGPASFLYGTNAMGGVINIVSKSVKQDGFTTSLTGGLGNFNSQELRGVHGGKMGKFDYYVTADTRNTDGHRANSGFEGDYYTLHAGYQFTTATSVALNANLSNINMFDPGTESAPLPDAWYDLKRSGVDLTVDHKSGLGESFLKLHGNFGKHKIYDGWRSTDQTVGVMFYHNVKPFAGNTMTVGFDIKQYGGDAEDSITQTSVVISDYGKHTITEWAPYIHSQQVLLKNVIASAGLRFENHELYGNELLPKAGLVYMPFTGTSLRLSAAKGFRSPTIRELYTFRWKNPDLEPERMWNYEFGIDQIITSTLQVQGTIFQADGENMIRTYGGFTGFFKNSGEFTHTGYEIVAKWVPMHNLFLTANWSKLDLQDETAETPGKKLGATITYAMPYVNFSATWLSIMDLYGADNYTNPMSDYNLVNLAAHIKPPVPYLSFKLAVKNLTDESYQTYFGYPMPGRTYMLDMSVGM